MIFYFIGVVSLIAFISIIMKDKPSDLDKIQTKILRDETLFVDEELARQSRINKGEYLSPTIDYSLSHSKN